MSTKQHGFDSTSDAYDATQCDATIRNGHTLMIDNEKVIGLASAWPVALTVEHGCLHPVVGDGASIIQDAGWTIEQIQDAVTLADKLAYPVAPWARQAITLTPAQPAAATNYRELAADRGFDILDTDEGYTWTARHFVMNSANEFDTEQEAWVNILARFPTTAEG
jgi:hypothetical protein